VSRQLPQHKYSATEKEHLSIPNALGREFNPEKPSQAKFGAVV